MTVNSLRGISREMFFRLCSRAPEIVMLDIGCWILDAGAVREDDLVGDNERVSSNLRRKVPVWLAAEAAISSGVPWATIWPPWSPASGPRSMTQSADLM